MRDAFNASDCNVKYSRKDRSKFVTDYRKTMQIIKENRAVIDGGTAPEYALQFAKDACRADTLVIVTDAEFYNKWYEKAQYDVLMAPYADMTVIWAVCCVRGQEATARGDGMQLRACGANVVFMEE